MKHLARCFLLGLAACSGGGPVEYVDGKCLINGIASTLAQVETRQAAVTQHILARQPVLTGIAVAAVLIAGASYIQRLLTVLAARRASEVTFAERVRARMEGYRAHPVRYFAILGATLGVLAVAGTAYVELDADKRTSERALATLQFCHLALRTADEQHVLAEQRDNLAAIQVTAGDIRALVDKLPPAEQQKAHDIVDQLTTTLGAQRTLVTRYAAQADESARAVAEKQANVERGISKLDGELGTLSTVPTAIDKLGGSLDGELRALAARHDELDARDDDLRAKLVAANARLDAMGKALDTIAAKPTVVCPTIAAPVVAAVAPAPAPAPKPAPKPATAATAATAPTPVAAVAAVAAVAPAPTPSPTAAAPALTAAKPAAP